MSIKLDFPNPHSAKASSVKIYRSTTKISSDALPAALVTLAGNVTTYTDTTAAANTGYFYMVEVVVGDDSVFTPNVSMGNFANVGPGPKTLKMGDWTLGYFGVVSPTDLLNFSELKSQLALSIGTVPADSTNLGWHKFVRNGKILYLCYTAFITGVTWENIYGVGLLYGVDSNGDYPPTSNVAKAPKNQKRTVTKNSDTFLVRAPSASNVATSTFVSGDPATLENTEFGDLAVKLGSDSVLDWLKSRWSDLAYGDYVIAQHMSTASYIRSPRMGSATILERSATATGSNYIPILELVL